ncbi:MAG: hypothetical protein RLZZ293_1097 [Pseudomonadota bacterium]|jgi:2-octaprenyl-6-methoxyphenol hydroxylase
MLHTSIAIIGGGPVGLALAIQLSKNQQQVVVLDDDNNKQTDGRVLALSFASQQFLEQLQAWDPHLATPINCVEISHKGLGISQINAEQLKLPHLGYTIRYSDVCAKLREIALASPLIKFITTKVSKVSNGHNYATIEYHTPNKQENNYLTSDLAIMAEGGKLLNNISYRRNYDYQQVALVAHIDTIQKPEAVAYERFASTPLVLLPFEQHFVAVWSLATNQANQLKNNPQQFEQCLNQEFTTRLGGAHLLAPIHSFPLRLTQVKQRVHNRMILIGNSAQTVHPVSAQGLNLGLRDVQILSQLLNKHNQDFTNLNLAQFDSLRNQDANAVINFTHFLATKMDYQNICWQHLRGTGLISLSNLPIIQNTIARSLIFGV